MGRLENKKKYDAQYVKENMKRIPLNVRKEEYEAIKTAADKHGESVSGYIKESIKMRMSSEILDEIV